MEVYVLNANREKIGIIDDYKSLIWAKRYIQFGDCEIYVHARDEYFSLLSKGNYLARDDDDMVCAINKLELDTSAEDGDYIIATGTDCRCLLNQRVVWEQTNYSGTVENYIRKIITDNLSNPSVADRQIDFFTVGEELGWTETISEQVTYTSLGDKIIEVCNTYQYGSRVTLDDSYNFVFNLYKGTDRSYNQTIKDYVVFSPEFDNIISSKYITDSTNIKNVALVAGEGEGIDRKRVTYGSASGIDRHEVYVDARDVSSQVEEGESIDYEAMLTARGIEALANYGTVESFEGEVEPNYSYKYGVDYYLGDIVQVMNEYGVSSSARVTEVIETFDQDGYSVIPTFQYQEVKI